jgi:hypothetical protein
MTSLICRSTNIPSSLLALLILGNFGFKRKPVLFRYTALTKLSLNEVYFAVAAEHFFCINRRLVDNIQLPKILTCFSEKWLSKALFSQSKRKEFHITQLGNQGEVKSLSSFHRHAKNIYHIGCFVRRCILSHDSFPQMAYAMGTEGYLFPL